jgi:hypothetical protein
MHKSAIFAKEPVKVEEELKSFKYISSLLFQHTVCVLYNSISVCSGKYISLCFALFFLSVSLSLYIYIYL